MRGKRFTPHLAAAHKENEEDREKEKVGNRPAKLNEKKSDGELEREIKNKGDKFRGRNNMKIL